MTTGVLVKQPTNTSLLQKTKYIFTMPRINNTQYFLQEAMIPGINLPALSRPTSVVDIYVPGNKLEYEQFQMNFLVDAELKSWRDIHDWMRRLTTTVSNAEYKQLWRRDTVINKNVTSENISESMPQYADGIMTVMSNLNNPKFRIKYVNLFPIALSDIQFASTDSAEDIITATATFRYDYYDIEVL
jgi:hypothetical protein